jgi:2-oxoglutarate ferredoxin oxidoreductase subunit beta
MFNQARKIRDKYLELSMYPSIFCTGCGVGNVLNYSLRALDAEHIDLDRTVFVSGIGCSSRLPGYIDADGLHTTHGRAIAFATGIKTADPDLTVVIFTGDGDAAGIGGNHLIHAARRTVDLTVVCINNFNYGMTGGQVSPTTPLTGRTTTTPYGNLETPFDLCSLVMGAGASYVARWTLGYPYETVKAVREGLQNRGFSFIEMLVPCPTGYAKRQKLPEGRETWDWYKKSTILRSKYLALTKEERARETRIVIGRLRHEPRAEFTATYRQLVDRLSRKQ